jgi:hypothetical protein
VTDSSHIRIEEATIGLPAGSEKEAQIKKLCCPDETQTA